MTSKLSHSQFTSHIPIQAFKIELFSLLLQWPSVYSKFQKLITMVHFRKPMLLLDFSYLGPTVFWSHERKGYVPIFQSSQSKK